MEWIIIFASFGESPISIMSHNKMRIMTAFSQRRKVLLVGHIAGETERWRVGIRPVILPFLLSYLVFFPLACHAASIYVSPLGDDEWSGEQADPTSVGRAGPKRTLEAAVRLAREMRKASPGAATPLEIILRGGVYEMPDTLALTADDSGTASSPLLIRAQAGEEPILSGGTALSPISQGDSLWTAKTPSAFEGLPFSQLYIAGERRQRVRMPKVGYYSVAGAVRSDDPTAPDAFRFYPGDVRPSSRIQEVIVRAFQKWSVYTMQAVQCDETNRILSFGPPARVRHRIPFDKTFLYVLENVADAPLAEGEWYFDRSAGEIRYAPRAGETAAGVSLVAPRLETLLRIQGGGEFGRKIQFVAFEGITFSDTDWKLPAAGMRSTQGAILTPGTVEVSEARDISFVHCTFRATGGYGLIMGADVRRSRVEGSIFENLGAGGVRIGSGDPADLRAPGRWSTDCVVRNNLISSYGQVHPDGIGIWVGYAGHTTIEHNDVTDGYYTGISVGWVWNYGVFAARDNIILQNRVWRIGQHVLSDLAGIYTLGEQPGTEIIGNVVSDIRGARYGGWGIYCDEGSASMLVKNNLVYNCSSAAAHLHWGRAVDIIGNVLALGQNCVFENTSPGKTGAYRFRDNVLLSRQQPFFGKQGLGGNVQVGGNLYISSAGAKNLFPEGADLSSWRRREPDASAEDPGFRNPDGGDFTAVHPELLSSREIDPALFRAAGRLSGAASPGVVRPTWRPASEPRSRPFSADFDGDGEDDLSDFVRSVAAPSQGIELSAERYHSAPSSLKFTDGPLGPLWQPLASREVNIKEGNVRVSLWIWAGKGSVPWVTLRDTRGLLVAGPSVTVSPDGQLSAGGRPLMPWPFETWVKVDMTFGIGKMRTPTWNLAIGSDSGDERSFKGMPLPSSFEECDWLGIAGFGSVAATFFVDDVSVTMEDRP